MTTIHANNTRDAIRRVENMVSMAGLNFPIHAIREQVSSALNILVQAARVTGGRRKIRSITEITGMEGDAVCMQDIFRFKQVGVDSEGHAAGHFEACGVRPHCLERILAEGIQFPAEMFRNRVLAMQAASGGPPPLPKGRI
jgi:pilus assembly protein CpaF